MGRLNPTTSIESTGGGRLNSTPITGKTDLTTASGLEQTARNAGLQKDVDRILSGKGENPKEIYSGGSFSDFFDTLNALQYGVTGVLKGKSFAEGVKTRQSFSDKDALGQYGIPGAVAGVALDIAVDPLTYVPVFGVGKKILQGGKKVLGKVGEVTAKNVPYAEKVGNNLGRAFIYRYGQDPIYAKTAERSIRTIQRGTENVLELARPITKLSPDVQRALGDARKSGELDAFFKGGNLPKNLTPEIIAKAKPAFDELDRLGKEAVAVGLLKKEIFDENVGKYMARLYTTKEAPVDGAVRNFFDSKPLRIDRSRFMKRKDIPDDVREAMGEIMEAGYPTAKSLVQLTQAVERAKLFKEVSTAFAKKEATEGFTQLPKTSSLGDLAGKYVPTPIYDDIQEMVRSASKFEQATRPLVKSFKYGKVILNPATHIRNIMSNMVLNSFEGLSPIRHPQIYAIAAKELKTKGKWYKEAKEAGLGLDSFAANELKDILAPSIAGSAKLKKAVDAIAAAYQKEEEFGKLAQFIFQRKKGKSVEEAWQISERATFNYAQVTPFIRRVRESVFGYPFITFTYKATPQVLRTAVEKPTKISNIGKIKQGIENQSDIEELTRERETEPDWVRDGFYMKLPIKDEHGRSAYLDLTYILPFGDLVSGQFIERGIDRETGLPENVGESQVRKLPFVNLFREIWENQDFTGHQIYKSSDPAEKQIADVFRQLLRFSLPPLLAEQVPGGYGKDGNRVKSGLQKVSNLGEKGLEGVTVGEKQARTPMQELLRHVGLKINPVDIATQELFAENERERALKTLLTEEGVISTFSRPFVPKDSDTGSSGGGRLNR